MIEKKHMKKKAISLEHLKRQSRMVTIDITEVQNTLVKVAQNQEIQMLEQGLCHNTI